MLSKKQFMAGLIPVGLVGALAAVAMAIVPAGASATEITPVKTAFTAKLTEGPGGGVISVFVPSNAYEAEGIGCTESTITGETPEEGAHKKNQNKPEIGTHSTGYGSVITVLKTVTYSTCAVYKWESGKWVKVIPEIKATVTTSTANGKWTLAAYQDLAQEEAKRPPYTAAGVPKAGATIEYEVLGAKCKITVSSEEASAVFDEWNNTTSSEPSKDRIDGQINYAHEGLACKGESPAQYEATYKVEPKIIIKA